MVSARWSEMSARIERIAVSLGVTVVVTATLVGCAPTGGAEPESVTGIPEQWLTATEEGWPTSDGFGRNIPVLSRDACLLSESAPHILEGGASLTNTGWGGYGADEDGYRYICGVHLRDAYAGYLQLLRSPNSKGLQEAFDEFRSQPSTTLQHNSVTEVTSGRLDLHVLTRWYPTNPQGLYQAMYFDEDANAIVSFEINSLNKHDFDALTPQDVADALVATMAVAS